MTAATSRVGSTVTPYGTDDGTYRDCPATPDIYYPGAMMCINSAGYVVPASDTAGLQFDGIMSDSARVEVLAVDAAGDKKIKVEQPRWFSMKIAAAVITDIGRAVYALYDNEVAYSGVSNSILVGWVHKVVNSTTVEIRPVYAGIRGDSSFDGAALTFTGSTGGNTIVAPDNLADGLSVVQGANPYITFVTTNSAERVLLAKQTKLADSVKLAFGDGDDITVAWDGTDLDILQATVNSSVSWGIDGAGIDQIWYGDTASAKITWDQSADSLILSGVAKIKLQTIAAGTGTAIPVTHSGSFPITQAGAETNTLADPTFLGQTLTIFVDTDTSGARVITAASRINQAANTIITLTEVGDCIKLEAITIAGALKWQVISNDGAALS